MTSYVAGNRLAKAIACERTVLAGFVLSLVAASAVLALCGTAMALQMTGRDKPAAGDHAGSPPLLLAKQVVIHNGCPAGLDKICDRQGGKLKNCRCAS
jgi:hypothetical protein